MEHSKYISYHRGKTPRKNKAKVMQGSFEDRSKYYKCWNCGFIFDIDQVSIGGDKAGNYSAPPESPVYNDGGKLYMETLSNLGGVCRTDSTGVVNQPVVLGYHKVSSGCPACGYTNQF